MGLLHIAFLFLFCAFFDDKLSRVHWCKKLKWSDMLLKCLHRPNSNPPSSQQGPLHPLSDPFPVACVVKDTKRSTLRALADTWASTSIVNFWARLLQPIAVVVVAVVCVVVVSRCCFVLSCSVAHHNEQCECKTWKLICRAMKGAPGQVASQEPSD